MKKLICLVLAVFMAVSFAPALDVREPEDPAPAGTEELSDTLQEETIPSPPEEETFPDGGKEKLSGRPAEEAANAALPEPLPPAATAPETFPVPPELLSDNENLFAEYVERTLYGIGAVSLYSDYHKQNLTRLEQIMYNRISELIRQVADGEITDTHLSTGPLINLTAEDLGVDRLLEVKDHTIDYTAEAKKALEEQLDSYELFLALLRDKPYDLYWFDKTKGFVGGRADITWSFDQGSEDYVSIGFRADMAVSPDYAEVVGGEKQTYATDRNKTCAAKTVAENALDVVSEAEGLSDIKKLEYYANYICSQVAYNTKAASWNWRGGYGDPWQLIYAFDNNPGTNIVCEGYSKAFHYLCDLSDFKGDVKCMQAVGILEQNGKVLGGHMWNVVWFGSAYYLIDLTNSDSGSTCNMELFMKDYSKEGTDSQGHIYYEFRTSSKGKMKFTYAEFDEKYPIRNPGDTVDSADFGLPMPVPGARAVTKIQNPDFSGKVTWSPALSDGKFQEGETYTATVELLPKENFAFATNLSVTLNGEACPVSPGMAANTMVLTCEFPPAVFREGDLNADGWFNEADVLEILYNINFKPYTFGEHETGDRNADGTIDILDAIFFTRQLADSRS